MPGPCIYKFDFATKRWGLEAAQGCTTCPSADTLQGGKAVEPPPGAPDEIEVECGTTEISLDFMHADAQATVVNGVTIRHRRPLEAGTVEAPAAADCP